MFITFGSCSLIGEFVDEFETKFSKVTYILTCIFNVAIPFGAAFMFNTSSNVNIMLFSIMALASYIITTLKKVKRNLLKN